MNKMLKTILCVLAVAFLFSISLWAWRIFQWNRAAEEPGLIDLHSVEEFYAVEDGIVYIGREECEHCQLFKPILQDILDSGNWSIYHLDTQYLREETDVTEEELLAFFGEYEIKGVPMLLEVKGGRLASVSHISQYKKIETDLMHETAQEYLQERMAAYARPGLLAQCMPLLISICLLIFTLIILAFWHKGIREYRGSKS